MAYAGMSEYLIVLDEDSGLLCQFVVVQVV